MAPARPAGRSLRGDGRGRCPGACAPALAGHQALAVAAGSVGDHPRTRCARAPRRRAGKRRNRARRAARTAAGDRRSERRRPRTLCGADRPLPRVRMAMAPRTARLQRRDRGGARRRALRLGLPHEQRRGRRTRHAARARARPRRCDLCRRRGDPPAKPRRSARGNRFHRLVRGRRRPSRFPCRSGSERDAARRALCERRSGAVPHVDACALCTRHPLLRSFLLGGCRVGDARLGRRLRREVRTGGARATPASRHDRALLRDRRARAHRRA